MGEYADMVLEGILCETCGEYLGEGDGFPQKCGGCAGVAGFEHGLSIKATKKRRLNDSTERLKDLGHTFTSHNNGLHLKVKSPVGIFDFWPSTGKYKRPRGDYGRGVGNLVNELKQAGEKQTIKPTN